MEHETHTKKEVFEKYMTPIAVLVGFALIAGAIYFKESAPETAKQLPEGPSQEMLAKIPAVTEADYIRGSRDAKAIVIEYSDTECPFCKRFHNTMKQVVADYNGDVAWVYRNFPLDVLHKKARAEAVALECAGKLGGTDAFWKFTDTVYERTPSNDGLDAAELPKIAKELGIDVVAFTQCQTSGEFDAKIAAQEKDAQQGGGQGTPYSVVIGKNGKRAAISGAYPLEETKQIIDSVLKQGLW